jgi:hypothetical protein
MRRYVSIRRNGALAETPTAWVALGILAPAAALLAALRLQPWAAPAELIGDGVVASIEGLLLVGAAAVCLFTAAMLRAAHGDASRIRFLAVAGLVTLWLGLGDVFAVHGEVLPALGVPRDLAAAAYLAVGALYLLASWRAVLANRPVLLLGAVLLFAASLRADALVPGTPAGVFAEAGLHLLAVAVWAGFHVIAAARAVEELATGRITAVTLASERLVRTA